ncbi:hypothetical protein H2199_008895 [Coniosporium tulheliwenetii]|uniref:Uncharacterized protein n=1 Tax=Coniosporium tulheliwenetii TaxID=3383036 RepID=A0ACC2YGZ2_9PEZI|nr:hypothetical protein H2199_008895 [Cladosporium sp. JES 115]
MSNANPYQVLGISQDVSDEAVKTAYRKSALRHHPDKAKRPEDVTTATERMKEINEAWEKLKPENRKATDAKIRMPGRQYAQKQKQDRAKEDFRKAQEAKENLRKAQENFRRRQREQQQEEQERARQRWRQERKKKEQKGRETRNASEDLEEVFGERTSRAPKMDFGRMKRRNRNNRARWESEE